MVLIDRQQDVRVNIIIIGAGTVGFALAEYLNKYRHHISVIETDTALCDQINSKLDVFTVNAKGSSPASLKAAGIQDADMIIAATPDVETNLLVCNFAKQYGVESRIARVKSGEFTSGETGIDLGELGVTHVVEPEKEVVKSIIQYIELPGVIETANFQSDNVYLRGYKVTESMPLANKTLAEINKLASPAPMLIVVIFRDGKSITPTGAERLLPDDQIVAIMPRESFNTFRQLLGKNSEKVKKVIISGDTLTALDLADACKPFAERTILVDPDEQHGVLAASKLEGIEVLHGDCTNTEMLQEIHIENTDFFIAAGEDTEDNVMSCLLSKAEGAAEVIAVNNTDRHERLFQSLGLDHIINPRKITAQRIISSILRMPISAHLGLEKADIQVTRFIAEKKSKIIGKPLQEFKEIFKRSIVIGAVMRGDHVIIPRGDTIILADDEVLVLCQSSSHKFAGRLFKAGVSLSV
ncbi:MAG: Trk system potassium transporter TrkA [Chitinivibrionales bacterium]|nr:Trk system potassium transporter TrkA [Chitinivibrionales bacterium]